MKCKDCEYCKSGVSAVLVGTIRKRMFFCRHPNQRAIVNYFVNHRLKSQVGYVGRGSLWAEKPETEEVPKWCPINRRKGESNGE